MKILLVYPKYPDTFWSFRQSLKFISKKAAFPPLGLLTVAAMLPKRWEKKLVDMTVGPLTDEQIEWADMIFLSAMLVQKESVDDVIRRCKAKNKTIVAGGPYFTELPDAGKGVDHLILNEGEVTLPLFLADLEKGEPKNVYASLERPDITKTPIPLWSLINLKDYSSMAVQYSRGCPFNCEFCDIVILNGREPRTKTSKQMLAEMSSLYDAGHRGSVFIVDDNFIGNKNHVKKFLPELITWQKEHRYPFKFHTEASLNLADDEELMTLMSKANFYKVFLGIETPNLDSLKECNKFQNTKQDLRESVRIIHRHGIQVMGGFIVGFDNDTESIFEAQMRFIQQTGIVTAMVGMLCAFPKTQLWHRLKAEGRLLKDPTGENTDGTLNFIPKMGSKKLVNGYKKLVGSLYSRKEYYRRIRTFIKSYKPTVRGRMSRSDLRAFFKSMLFIGIASNSRFQYWKLFFSTTFTKPKALPVAIEMAIFGLHFEKMAKRIAAGC